MHSEKWYYVYMMANRSKNLYTGMTSNIRQRVFQHKTGAFEGFTSTYKIDRLVYWERFGQVHQAIAREKQLKGWSRIKKMYLIIAMNAEWKDLAEDWFPDLNTTKG